MDKVQLIKELNELNSKHSSEELKDFAVQYVTINAPELAWINKVSKSFFGTYGALAKICMSTSDEVLHKRLKEGLKSLRKFLEEEKTTSSKVVASKQQRVNPILFAFDGKAEEVMKGGKVDASDISHALVDASRQERNEAVKELERLQEEMESKELDFVEAYNIPQKKGLLRLVKEALEKIKGVKEAATKKRVRRSKKGKAVNTVKVTEKVKFCSEFNGVKGKHPALAVGKKKIWAYDTEDRKLILFVTSSEQGFTFTGTTLKNVDEEKSFSKKIRKPEEFFKRLASESLSAIMKSIRAKELKVRTRFNESLMILDVA